MTSKFRPLGLPPTHKHKSFLKYGKNKTYNWVPREFYMPCGKYRSPALLKAFSILHYLACHSPNKLRLKYQNSYTSLIKKHVPNRCSLSYNNKFSPF